MSTSGTSLPSTSANQRRVALIGDVGLNRDDRPQTVTFNEIVEHAHASQRYASHPHSRCRDRCDGSTLVGITAFPAAVGKINCVARLVDHDIGGLAPNDGFFADLMPGAGPPGCRNELADGKPTCGPGCKRTAGRRCSGDDGCGTVVRSDLPLHRPRPGRRDRDRATASQLGRLTSDSLRTTV